MVGGREGKNFRKNLLQVDESESKFDILKNVFISYKKKKNCELQFIVNCSLSVTHGTLSQHSFKIPLGDCYKYNILI